MNVTPTQQHQTSKANNTSYNTTKQKSAATSSTSPPQKIPVITGHQRNGTSRGADKTLLIGSSILHGINPRGLKKGVFKHAKSGAGVNEIYDEIQYFDLNQFNTIVLYVGGNDCSKGVSEESFALKYSKIVDDIKSKAPSSELLLCELALRSDVDVREFNLVINEIASTYGLRCIELFRDFLLRGYTMKRYYSNDAIHLSFSGIKRLLGQINKETNIVADFNTCTFYRGSLPNRNIKQFPVRRHINTNESVTNNWRPPTRNRHSFVRDNIIYSMDNHQTQAYRPNQTFKGTCFYCETAGHKHVNCPKLNQ